MREQIESALLAAQGSRAGAKVPQCPQALIDAGYATASGNLTERGARKRDYVMARRIYEAFGE